MDALTRSAPFLDSGSGNPVFITKVDAGILTQVTLEVAEGLVQIGWTAPTDEVNPSHREAWTR